MKVKLNRKTSNLNKWILLCSFFLIQHLSAYAQNSVLQGRVISEDNAPIPYATVALFQDSVLVTGTTTNTNGDFHFDEVGAGVYNIVFRFVGYKEVSIEVELTSTNRNLKDVILPIDSQVLGDVVIKGQLPSIVRKVDRFVVNIGNSAIASGKNALEALRYAPGILFSPGGGISLNGKSGLLIYVDGKQLNLDEESRLQFIRSLRAEDVERYEIIPNATAKYGAEGQGGVIDIYLKRSVQSGLSGGVHFSLSQYEETGYSSGINLTHNRKNTSIYGTYSYTHTPSYSKEIGHKTFLETKLRQDYNSVDYGDSKPHNYRVGVRQEIGKKHEIGIEMYGNISDSNGTTKSTTTLSVNEVVDSVAKMDGLYYGDNQNTNYSLNYTFNINDKGQKLKFLADYSNVHKKLDETFTNRFFNDSELLSENKKQQAENNRFYIYSSKLNYESPINEKTSMEAGVRYSNTLLKNKNDFWEDAGNGWIINNDFTTRYNYRETLLAAYAMLKYNSGKFNGNIGLRGERIGRDFDMFSQDFSTKNSELEWFPSVFIQYMPNESKKISMTYTRRINRPSYYSLMPFSRFIDNYTIGKGNPTLLPSFVNSINLSLAYKNIHLSFATDFIDDKIYPIYKPEDPENGLSYYQLENINRGTQHRVNLYFPLRVAKWWELSNNFSLTSRRYKDNRWGVDEKKWIYQMNISSSIVLPSEIYWDVDLMMLSKSMMGVAEYQDGGILVSTGLSKNFLNGNLTASFSVDDMFGLLNNLNVTSSYNNIESQVNHDFNEQGISFSLRYRFQKGKKVKSKVNESSNSFEKSRTK